MVFLAELTHSVLTNKNVQIQRYLMKKIGTRYAPVQWNIVHQFQTSQMVLGGGITIQMYKTCTVSAEKPLVIRIVHTKTTHRRKKNKCDTAIFEAQLTQNFSKFFHDAN